MNHEIIDQQINELSRRLKMIEDKYPTVQPEYIKDMATVMISLKIKKLTIGQVCIETQEKI